MPEPLKRIVITGGSGQIAYSLLFRIASGELLGPNQPIALHILELPEMMGALEGVKMELEDGAYRLLKEIHIGTDPYKIFQDADIALLIGAAPRSLGMERGELLSLNCRVFVDQGKALNEVANRHVQVFVIGNPCNTNCLVAMSQAPRIPKENFHAMTRLDQNRAVFQLAQKSGASISEVSPVIIWGNHSSTQVPDYYHAKIRGKPVTEVIADKAWLEREFMSIVQQRGANVIKARGKSSAASAAQAIIDDVREAFFMSSHLFSSGVWSEGNPYGIDSGLIFSFPCLSIEAGKWQIVLGFRCRCRRCRLRSRSWPPGSCCL